MLSPNTKSVQLPDGLVTISNVPLEWYTIQNGTGFVSPSVIAPDPKNVRKRMNEAKMAELRTSVKNHGVKQPLVVTPRKSAPWAEVDPAHCDCFFLAVSGHRRRQASLDVHLGAVPVMVKIYPSEKEHRLDVSLLNKGNEDLTALEEGYEILELQKVGWKIAELCKEFEVATPQLYMRTNLTKLDVSLQRLLDPETPKSFQLGTTLGGELGSIAEPTLDELWNMYEQHNESIGKIAKDAIVPYHELEGLSGDDRRFALQRLNYEIIKLRGLNAGRAIQFIRDGKLTLSAAGSHGGAPTPRYKPSRRKEILARVVDNVVESMPVDWTDAEWRRIFELSPREEVESTAIEVRNAQEVFRRIGDKLEEIAKTKRASNPEVEKFMTKYKK